MKTNIPSAQTAPAPAQNADAVGSPARWPWLAAAVLAVALAGLGYELQTSIAAIEPTSGTGAAMGAAPQDAAHAAGSDEMSAMLERHPQALAAFQKAVTLSPNDAGLIADYADSLAMKQGSLSGQPLQQVQRALELDAHNLKALFLAGAEAMDRRDTAAAVKYWEQLVRFGPADNGLVQQVLPVLAQTRQLAGMPAGSGPAESVPANAAGTVSGRVILASALMQGVSPEDTVFIMARTVAGEGAPLAVLRRQVKDLPLQFVLDDSMGMSAQARLSGASQVVVSALLSKSGQATAQSGDLLGRSAAASVGTSGLVIEIRELVK